MAGDTGAALDPAGRVVMVSGANRGIGQAIARRLHADGYTLSLGARDVEALAHTVAGWAGAPVHCHPFEARDAESPAAWAAATAARFGRIDGLVNNAGIMRLFAFDALDEAALDEMWEVNVKAPYRLIMAALPHLRRAASGRIVNVVSLSGLRTKGGQAQGYAMTKHAALALSQAARQACWADGIRVTALCPGFVATDMVAEVLPFPAAEATGPESVAALAALALALPDNASVAFIPVNCVLENSY